MISIEKRRFAFFLGFSLLFYVIVFFPNGNETIEIKGIVLDFIKSFASGFVVIYVSNWIGLKFPRQQVKE